MRQSSFFCIPISSCCQYPTPTPCYRPSTTNFSGSLRSSNIEPATDLPPPTSYFTIRILIILHNKKDTLPQKKMLPHKKRCSHTQKKRHSPTKKRYSHKKRHSPTQKKHFPHTVETVFYTVSLNFRQTPLLPSSTFNS